MMPFLSMIAAGIALTLVPASTAQAAPAAGFSEGAGGVLRHSATGLAFPPVIGSLARQGVDEGRPIVVLYAAPSDPDPMKHFLTVAIGSGVKARAPEDIARAMREGGAARGKPVQTISEGPFAWPGHPKATTFRGRYRADEFVREVWAANEGGTQVVLMITAPDIAELDRLSTSAGRQLFGGDPAAPRPPR